MPNRLIREGWLDSEAIDALTPESERFFHRLCLTADDAGRFDGRIDILRARLFPLKASLRASDVGKWQTECSGKGLVIPYERDGKPYLQIAKWQRCSPCVTSKYPWVDGSFRIVYVKRETRDGDKEFVSSSLAEGIGKPSDPLERGPVRISGDGDGDGDGDAVLVRDPMADFPLFYSGYPKKEARGKAEEAWKKLSPSVEEVGRILADVKAKSKSEKWLEAGGKFIPMPATYLNQKRWTDEGVLLNDTTSNEAPALAAGEWR